MSPREVLRGRRIVVAVILTIAVSAACCGGAAQETTEQKKTGAPAEINQPFVDPDLEIDTWVQRFEGESREVFAARHEIVAATGVERDDRVVDVGAGTGLYTRLFAEAVGGGGWVWAVDIGPRFLEYINQTVSEKSLNHVTAVLGRTDSVALPGESVDLAFVCDTYHHLELVEPMLDSIHRALVDGGMLVVVDFERVPGKSRQWVLDHVRAGKETFRGEIESAGFEFVEEVEITGFKENYFLKFRKK